VGDLDADNKLWADQVATALPEAAKLVAQATTGTGEAVDSGKLADARWRYDRPSRERHIDLVTTKDAYRFLDDSALSARPASGRVDRARRLPAGVEPRSKHRSPSGWNSEVCLVVLPRPFGWRSDHVDVPFNEVSRNRPHVDNGQCQLAVVPLSRKIS
jgi:hypothetical protein